MKKLKKKVAALGVGLSLMVSAVASMSASAATYVNWRPSYAPTSGTFYASKTAVIVQDLVWTSSQVTEFGKYILRRTEEFEFRPYDPARSVWNGSTTTNSNLPRVYYEDDDPDDVTIGCGDVSQLRSGTAYYATMGLRTAAGFTDNAHPYTFEAELCEYIPLASEIKDDYLPLEYSRYRDKLNNVTFGNDYNW